MFLQTCLLSLLPRLSDYIGKTDIIHIWQTWETSSDTRFALYIASHYLYG